MGHSSQTEDGFEFLKQLSPCFAVHGDKIKVLEKPSDFYDTLVNGIKTAKHRIVLSALYLGTDKMERELMDCLQKTISKSEASEDAPMDVDILFDFVRGSRGDENSKTMLLPLVKQYCNPTKECKTNVNVSFFHTPLLRGAWKKVLPARFNEIIGLGHMKIYIFDNALMISGANLSLNYFEQRQDRYILFNDCHELADYFQSLVQAVSKFSFQLQPNGSVEFCRQCPNHPFNGDFNLFADYAQDCLQDLVYPYQASTHQQYSLIHKGLLRVWNLLAAPGLYALQLLGVRGALTTNNINDQHGLLKNKVFTHEKHTKNNADGSADTLVYPSVQLGCIGIRQDEVIMKNIFNNFPKSSYVCFTSGYFNITDTFSKQILNSSADFDVLIASPEANGFLGAAGLSGSIPAMYVNLTKQFYDEACQRGRSENIKICEYMRPDWTYHAKGMWFYEENKTLPSMTVIGSSNFGLRSANRDLEAQVTIITKNVNLMKQLHREKCQLQAWSKAVNCETFKQPRYYIPRWVSLISNLIKHYF